MFSLSNHNQRKKILLPFLSKHWSWIEFRPDRFRPYKLFFNLKTKGFPFHPNAQNIHVVQLWHLFRLEHWNKWFLNRLNLFNNWLRRPKSIKFQLLKILISVSQFHYKVSENRNFSLWNKMSFVVTYFDITNKLSGQITIYSPLIFIALNKEQSLIWTSESPSFSITWNQFRFSKISSTFVRCNEWTATGTKNKFQLNCFQSFWLVIAFRKSLVFLH